MKSLWQTDDMTDGQRQLYIPLPYAGDKNNKKEPNVFIKFLNKFILN